MYDDSKDMYNLLVELLWETNKTKQAIAAEMGITLSELQKRIKYFGLDWIRSSSKKMSRGQQALTQIMRKIMPGEEIVNEYHIGERLMLDVFCPKYKIAAEFHGRQHFEFIPYFHDTYDEYVRSCLRDDRKLQLCEEQGITLVVFRYCDNLTEDLIYTRIMDELRETTAPKTAITKKPRASMKHTPQYEQWAMKRKAFERDLRKKIKQDKKDREAKKKAFYEDQDDEWS